MFDLSTLMIFVAAALILLITPGPAVLFIGRRIEVEDRTMRYSIQMATNKVSQFQMHLEGELERID